MSNQPDNRHLDQVLLTETESEVVHPLAALERRIETETRELGEIVLALYRQGALPAVEMAEAIAHCQTLEKLHQEAAQLSAQEEAKTSASNAEPDCPACGAVLTVGEVYCPHCGFLMGDAALPGTSPATTPAFSQPVADDPLPAPQPRAHCGQLLEDDMAYCPLCGESVPVAGMAASGDLPAAAGSPTATCLRCGLALRPVARFCPACGQPRGGM